MGLLQLAVTWFMLEGKLPTGTSKTKRLHQDKFEFSLFWMSQWASCKRPIVLMILILLSTIFKVPNAEFQILPNQSNTRVGSHTDFSSLITKPALYKSPLRARALCDNFLYPEQSPNHRPGKWLYKDPVFPNTFLRASKP